MATFEGGCQCGAVRYEVTVDRLVGYACHCLECQKQSASAFGISIPVPVKRVRFDGSMKAYRRPTDIGTHTDCWFCENCGTRICHKGSRDRDWVTLKGGSLDRSDQLTVAAHIWVKRKQPWILLPSDAPAHDTQPDDLDAWRQAHCPVPNANEG